MKADSVYIDTDLITLCGLYLWRKKPDATLWDLISLVHKTITRLDKINAKHKKVIFQRGFVKVDENWLRGFGLTKTSEL